MGASFRKSMRYHAAYAFRIRQDFIIPEAQHLESLAPDKGVTSWISAAFVVLATVQFDDQSRVQASKICDVRANGMLATEAETFHLSQLEGAPEPALGQRHVTTQLPCTVPLLSVSHVHVLC